MLVLDSYVHTSSSFDSNLNLNRLVKKCKKTGLNTVFLADHNLLASCKKHQEFARSHGVELIPGVELETDFGDIIGVFPVADLPELSFDFKNCKSIEEFIDFVKEKEGFSILPHPFYR
ncbi:MAG: PHP domain-containing protein [Candidatus Bathyarchaeota archaeon]|nr:PHP domain-containing protein [Candidatus Bathyarchaeota archaeon]